MWGSAFFKKLAELLGKYLLEQVLTPLIYKIKDLLTDTIDKYNRKKVVKEKEEILDQMTRAATDEELKELHRRLHNRD